MYRRCKKQIISEVAVNSNDITDYDSTSTGNIEVHTHSPESKLYAKGMENPSALDSPSIGICQ